MAGKTKIDQKTPEELQMIAEEYRKLAEEHKHKSRESWAVFLKTGLFVIAAAIVLVAFAIAWFVVNSRVGSNTNNIGATSGGFKLRSKGKNDIHTEDIISKFFGDEITVGDGTPVYTYSTDAADSINWLVTDESNIGNYNDDDIDFSQEDRKNYAIKPGSKGYITFYIVPDQDGTQTFDMQLSVIPYAATINTSTKEITSVSEVGKDTDASIKKYARKFAEGHIIFYWKEEGASDDTLTRLEDGKFSVTIEDAEAGEEYGYTFRWIWPQVFSEVVLNDGDKFLNGRDLILTSGLRDDLIADMMERPDYYFYNSLTKNPLNKTDELISGEKGMSDIHAKSPDSTGDDGYVAQNFVDLSSFYNQADQIIGSQISFIMIELTGELEGGQHD